ncbi:MAG: serine--tRNA ligase [Elusimicrobia bacterium]|nr:serine--tRNA ligase [Candidatus Liberimonas magnetica]
MLDIKLIRENPDLVKQALEKRGKTILLDDIICWDATRRKVINELNALQEIRNKKSDEIGKLKSKKDPIAGIVTEMNKVNEEIKEKEKITQDLDKKIEEFLLNIPNIPDETTPVGRSAQDNKVVRRSGDIPSFDFTAKNHWEIGEKLGVLDFETAAKLSGARFALLKGAGCVLERALINFMIDVHIKKGYSEVMAPYLVSSTTMQGTGQLPKFADELFKCKDDDLYLIPTAEVSVTNIHRDEFIEEKDLPKKYVSYSACFRREAGSYGKDTKGLIRNHQFNKVELVKIVKPETSGDELESLTLDAEEVLKLLGIPYRVIALCTGDIGFSSAKTYDLEVWMPGEKTWREISSCSNFKDFQARRMNIKIRYQDKRKEFAHTLNGSGVAIGRTFAAILENYQQKDGSVLIPKALQPYTKIDKLNV